MHRRHFLAAVGTASLAGCSNVGSRENGRLDLTVQNDGSEPVTAEVVVEGDDGTSYENTSERVDAGVAQAFEVIVGTTGRHTVTVSGADWEGQLAWDAGVCGLYDGTVRVADDRLDVLGECVSPR